MPGQQFQITVGPPERRQSLIVTPKGQQIPPCLRGEVNKYNDSPCIVFTLGSQSVSDPRLPSGGSVKYYDQPCLNCGNQFTQLDFSLPKGEVYRAPQKSLKKKMWRFVYQLFGAARNK